MLCRNESKFLLICALLACSTLSYGQDSAVDDVAKKTTSSTTTTTTTTATEKPSTTTTTLKPTAPPTTPTTTTTRSTTSTSTPPPTTTTVKPSPTPTPPPEPEMGKWNTSCIIIQMAAKFNLTYETKDNNIAKAQINLPKQSAVDNSSTCLETTQQIILEWGTPNNLSSIMMQFEKKNDNYFLYELYLKIILNDVEFPEAKNNNIAIAQINLPKQSRVANSSTCLETTQQIILEWGTSSNLSSLMMGFEQNNFFVEYGSSVYFLFDLYLKIVPNDVEFPEAKNNNIAITQIHLPKQSRVADSSACVELNQQIVLEWGTPNNFSSLMIHFFRDIYWYYDADTSIIQNQWDNYYLDEVQLKIVLNDVEFPDAKNHNLHYIFSGNIYCAPTGLSYSCREQAILMRPADSAKIGSSSIIITNLQLQAFNDGSKLFSPAFDCEDKGLFYLSIVFLAIIAIIIIVILYCLFCRAICNCRRSGYTNNKTANATINLPLSATVDNSSTCYETTQQLVLEWGPKSSINSLLIQFEKNGTDFVLYELYLKVAVAEDEFPKAKSQVVQLIYIGNTFVTPLSRSYHCTKAIVLPMNPSINDSEIVGNVTLSKLQLEAFLPKSSNQFSTAIDCEGADTNDVVPIAVGIALISLVLVVLISYLFARRRSTARGYMSF